VREFDMMRCEHLKCERRKFMKIRLIKAKAIIGEVFFKGSSEFELPFILVGEKNG